MSLVGYFEAKRSGKTYICTVIGVPVETADCLQAHRDRKKTKKKNKERAAIYELPSLRHGKLIININIFIH